jgi:hypothetical protein
LVLAAHRISIPAGQQTRSLKFALDGVDQELGFVDGVAAAAIARGERPPFQSCARSRAAKMAAAMMTACHAWREKSLCRMNQDVRDLVINRFHGLLFEAGQLQPHSRLRLCLNEFRLFGREEQSARRCLSNLFAFPPSLHNSRA